jgi:hypothetical protein
MIAALKQFGILLLYLLTAVGVFFLIEYSIHSQVADLPLSGSGVWTFDCLIVAVIVAAIVLDHFHHFFNRLKDPGRHPQRGGLLPLIGYAFLALLVLAASARLVAEMQDKLPG